MTVKTKLTGVTRTEQSRASIEDDDRFQALHTNTQKLITFVLENRSSFEDELRFRTQKLDESSSSQNAATRSVVTAAVQDTVNRS